MSKRARCFHAFCRQPGQESGSQAKTMKLWNDPIFSHVIVIDDDRAVRNSLKFSLEVEGFKVRTYATAGDLLDAPQSPVCACFVVDQNMPGMSGLDLIARLRERRISTPAVLMTTQPNATVTERARCAQIPIVEKPLFG